VVALSGTGNATGLTSLVVTPANPSVPLGETQQFTATGHFKSGSTQNLTASVTWSALPAGVATINAAGLASTVAQGSTTITATLNAIKGSTSLSVTAPVLVSIAVTPANPSIAAGTTQQFTATGTYSDGSTQNLTSTATWSSSVPGVATISTTGLASALAPGQTTIAAASGAINGSTTLTVTAGFVYTGSLNTPRFQPTATLLNNGMVLIAGGYNNTSGNYLASAELYNPAAGTFTPTGNLNTARYFATATLLTNGMVLIAGGYNGGFLASAELYNPATGSFTATGSLNTARYFATATLLTNGMVLIAGGENNASGSLTSAELYNPATGTFTPTGSLSTARFGHTATLLNNGLVLIAAGFNGSFLVNAELYNPATGTFTPTGSLNTPRYAPTATLLNNGMVLMAGGEDDSAVDVTATAELYNPASGTFSSTGSMNTPRYFATATLLNNGMVLMAGGETSSTILASAELYNPATGTFSLTGSMNTARLWDTATLLNNGMVLVAGGWNGPPLASAELYEPATLTPPNLVSISLAPSSPTVPLDTAQRLIATGTFSDSSTQQLASVTWSSSNPAAVSISDDASDPGTAYAAAAGAATVSACAGAVCGSTTVTVGPPALVSIAVTPVNGTLPSGLSVQFSATGTYSDGSTQNLSSSVTWTSSVPAVATINAGGMATGLAVGSTTITATLNATSGSTTLYVTAPVLVSIAVTPVDPSIAVGTTQQFMATGTYTNGSTQNLTNTVTWSSSALGVATMSTTGLASAVAPGQTTIAAALGAINGSTTLTVTAGFVYTGSLNTARYGQTATLLNNGLVLMAGGINSSNGVLTSAELYNPATGTFTTTGNLNTARYGHTATLLNNGMVLIAGGQIGSITSVTASAELYNPATGTFTYTGSLNTARQLHTATLLNNGMVLIAGGWNSRAYLASAELYNPATGTFTVTGSMNSERYLDTATLLNNGMVLVAGGSNGTYLASAELYNPATGMFTATGSLNTARELHTATLLNNGMVLMAGGYNGGYLSSAELYNPATGTFTLTGSLNSVRLSDTATLLNNGMVLMAGGYNSSGAPLASAELYNPATGTFTLTGSLNTARFYHTATLLNNGMVLMAGGYNGAYLASAELYEPATLTPPNLVSISLSPSSPTVPLDTAQRFTATGTFSDNSTEQLASVTWSSSNPAAVSISDDASNPGTAYAAGAGAATISACAGSVCGSTTTTIGPPALESIALTPANGTLPSGLSVQFSATGTYSDGSTQNLTSSVTWSSSVPAVATINAGGMATGLAVGSTTITAASGAVQGSTTLTVTAPLLVSIAVTPLDPSIAVGTTQQFTATGTYTNGSTQNLTSTVTWSSSAPSVATISTTGLASAVGVGATTIEAASGAINGCTALTVTAGFVLTGSLKTARANHTATLLNNGLVLIAGGWFSSTTPFITASAELYNPANGTFTPTGSLNTARTEHTATLLNNGMVLIVGGQALGGAPVAELYNPATGIFTTTGSLNTPRYGHTATLLNNGMVLISGGFGGPNGNDDYLATAELYDPTTGVFTYTGSLDTARTGHTATLLNNGLVLIAGGYNHDLTNMYLDDAELYNPATGTFTATGSLNTARANHTATLLNDGTVLIAGGGIASSPYYITSAEVYNPATGTFTPTGSLNTARQIHTATLLSNSLVLIAGGQGAYSGGTYPLLASAELYNPATGAFTYTGSMNTARANYTATLLNNGTVLMAGGSTASNTYGTASAELYEPATLTPPDLESIAVTPSTSTLSPGTTQKFIATGTFSDSSTEQLASVTWMSSDSTVAQISNDATNPGTSLAIAAGTVTITATDGNVSGSATLTVRPTGFVDTGSLKTGRWDHTATLLNNGLVLVVGGCYISCSGTGILASAELYNPATGTFTPTGSLKTARYDHTATLLDNGLVLVAGGYGSGGYLASAELYNPATGTFTPTGSVKTARTEHTAALLNNGLVLVAGGYGSSGYLASAELYNPGTGTFSYTTNLQTGVQSTLNSARNFHTATLLDNGMVLIAGGSNGTLLANAELYNPATGTFSYTTSGLNTARAYHTATLLNNGMVLIAGGVGSSGYLDSAELYNPATATFSYTTNLQTGVQSTLNSARDFHTATLLNDGLVLIAGGYNGSKILAGAEIYNPATGTFTTTGSLNTGRVNHTATLLNSGMVLIVGGEGSSGSLTSAELY
jgi:hypothetical protein